jgi:hypothetical protein
MESFLNGVASNVALAGALALVVFSRALVTPAVDAKGALVEDARAFAKQLGFRTCPPIRVLDAHIPPVVYAAWPRPFLLFPGQPQNQALHLTAAAVSGFGVNVLPAAAAGELGHSGGARRSDCT